MAVVRKTQEQRDAEVAELKARLDAAVERLANDPDQWVEFLDVISQFAAHYSWGNQLLLLVQCQERGFNPTMIRPYGSRDSKTRKPRSGWAGGWLTLGRNVKKGEKALSIWRPNLKRFTEEEAAAHLAKTGKPIRRDSKGRLPKRVVGWGIAKVFDLSQTEGDDVELPPQVTVTRKVRAPGGKRPELLTGEDTTGAFDAFVSLVQAEGYTFEFVPKSELKGANGVTMPGTRQVKVRDDVDPAQAVKTTVHELAHILCGHVNDGFDYHQHRGQAETEAESVAYIVLGALGLDSEKYSAPYVASWAEGDMEKVARSAQLIVKVARQILSAFDVPDESEDDEPELLDNAA